MELLAIKLLSALSSSNGYPGDGAPSDGAPSDGAPYKETIDEVAPANK
jgi:hypothetical protein